MRPQQRWQLGIVSLMRQASPVTEEDDTKVNRSVWPGGPTIQMPRIWIEANKYGDALETLESASYRMQEALGDSNRIAVGITETSVGPICALRLSDLVQLIKEAARGYWIGDDDDE